MRKSFQKVFLCFSVVLFSSCMIQNNAGMDYIGQKDDCGFALNQYTGDGLRWNKSDFPVSFYIHESVPPGAHQNFISAIDHWNIAWAQYLDDERLEYFPLFNVVSATTLYSGSPKQDGFNMLFFVNKDFSKLEGTQIQAFTRMNYSSNGAIKDTDIIVNNETFSYFYDESYDKEIVLASGKNIKSNRGLASSSSGNFWIRLKQRIQNWFQFLLNPFQKKKSDRLIAKLTTKVPKNQVDFPSLMIHELGHVPGMAHFNRLTDGLSINVASKRRSIPSKKVVSVMEPLLSAGRARRDMQHYDLENLICGYFGY